MNWNFPVYLSIMYIGIVVAGKKCMETRNRYDLRRPMLAWSVLLAVFSIIGTTRMLIMLQYLYTEGGIRRIVCDTGLYHKPITRFWCAAFLYSKFFEYVDTLFIIFRKQNLIFLHWYHHLTVALFCWSCYDGKNAGGAVFMSFNCFIHAMMYTYYAIRAAGVKLPRFVSVVITGSQIIQMVIGCLTMYGLIIWRSESSCRTTDQHLLSGVLMYASYLVLFIHFFYNAYMKKRPRAPQKEVRI
ncbi:very long chain fatty acid elongase 6-like [Ciona intestinalis]